MGTAREALTALHDKMVLLNLEHVGTMVTTEEKFKIEGEKIDALFAAIKDIGVVVMRLEESKL